MTQNHQTVLLTEAVAALAIQPAGWYIDGTYGRGGHTRAILAQLSAQGRVLAIDKDAQALAQAAQEWKDDSRIQVVQGSFAQLKELASQHGMLGKVAGILLDLGVSSPQLADPARGFSFMADGPLDMRMDQRTGISAADFLATVDEDTLIQVLKEYGEERFARRITHAIIAARAQAPITRTLQLTEIVTRAVPKREPHKHPATRTFQALRIWINNELGDLESVLKQSLEVLAPGGRLVVISFHSLEDRMVKHFMRDQYPQPWLPREIPLREKPNTNVLKTIGKAQKPSAEEIALNPRARSAIMRVAEKIR